MGAKAITGFPPRFLVKKGFAFETFRGGAALRAEAEIKAQHGDLAGGTDVLQR
jgi:hypothetical protein